MKTATKLANWPLAIMGGCAVAYFYTFLNSWLQTYSHILVQYFPYITSREGKWYLLYLGHFISGAIGALLTAFLTVYILGFFFRECPFMFGIITGLIGVPLLLYILIFSVDPFSPSLLGHTGFVIGEIINWVILVALCGIAAELGNKTQRKCLTIWERTGLV